MPLYDRLCCWLQLFGLVEAQSGQLLQPAHLHMAFLARLHLGDATAACDAATSHAPLATAWTAQQQGSAFKTALQALHHQPFAYAALRAALQVWLLAVSNNFPDKQQQLYDLLMALLSKERLPDAHKVGDTLAPVESSQLQLDLASDAGSTVHLLTLLPMRALTASVVVPSCVASASWVA